MRCDTGLHRSNFLSVPEPSEAGRRSLDWRRHDGRKRTPTVWTRTRQVMRINRGHWQRVAAILIGLAGTLGIGGLVGAEPVIGPAVAPATSSGLHAFAGSAETQSPAVDFNEKADTKYSAVPGNSARELLLMDRQWTPPDSGRFAPALDRAGTYPLASSVSSAESGDASGLADWTHELNNTVKYAVRPVFEELAGSSFVAAVRDLDAELGLNRRWSFNDPTSGSADYSQNAGRGDRAEPDNRARSTTQIEADRVTARIRVDKYIEEIKSWLLSLFGLLVVGYLAKLGLDYRHWKTARRRKHWVKGVMKGAKSLRRRRSKRRVQVAAPGKLGA